MPRRSYQIAFWSVAAVGALYASFIALLTNPWLQRQALYAHKINSLWLYDIDDPTKLGFAEHQVSSFHIETPDTQSLHAWHILPLGLYAQHATRIRSANYNEATSQVKDSIALQLLQDPSSQLIIYFHGNAGHVAQGWRPDAYKSLLACGSKNTHVLAFDYRGFGHSSPEPPSEEGLIVDGVAVVEWALNVANVSPERIVLLGHSLGTAVATAVADHFASLKPSITFAGLVLVSGFGDIPTLMKTYRIGGFLPILSPLRHFSRLERLVSNHIIDTWNTTSRLTHLASVSSEIRLSIVHAKNDFDIEWRHADLLYDAALAGISQQGLVYEPTEVLDTSGLTLATNVAGNTRIQKRLLQYGGHNKVIASAQVSLDVHELFELAPLGQNLRR